MRGTLSYLRLLASAVLVVSCLDATARAASIGVNLIANPGAEADVGQNNSAATVVNPTSWIIVSGTPAVQLYINNALFPTPADPGPPGRGLPGNLNLFTGGNSTPSVARQIFDLIPNAAAVDAGLLTFHMEAFLGGFETQNDDARLQATFLDISSATLATAILGPVTATDRGGVTALLLRTLDGAVPVGTRSVRLDLILLRVAGSDNDGYADDLVFRVDAVPEPAALGLLALGALALRARIRRVKDR